MTSYQDTIADHFIKIVLFQEHQDVEHWKYEIDEYITSKINKIRLKPNNRKLRYEEYFEILFDEPIGHEGALDYIVKGMFRLKRIPYIPKVNFEEVRMKLKIMYEELCDDLSIDNYDGIDKYIDMLRLK